MERMTTDGLRERLSNGGAKLIDVRPVDAYNGWRLRGEKRGGHIPSARSLPSKWTAYLDWPDIVRGKGLRPHDYLVLYGYDMAAAECVGARLQRSGFGTVAVYAGFADEWAESELLPMERLARYRHLVPASWLHELLRTGAAPEGHSDRHVLCHTHYRNRGAYDQGHIPGAVELDTNALESPETWNRRSPRELEQALRSLGITHDTTVVLYGRFSSPDSSDPFPGSSAGHLGAFRCAFIMLYAGVRDVRILNGGLQAWTDAGYATATEETPKRAVPSFGVDIPARPELAVDLPEARRMLAADDADLVSVRSWPEIVGEVSGYNYIEKKGRIPGAVFADCGSDAYHMENYRNLDHTTREYHEIERHWQQAGITADKHNAFYCGTGWRGSEAFFNAWLMGWPRVSVFDGGWFEWSRDERNPWETGVPEKLRGAPA